jgi:hypothetical protein
MKKKQSLSPGNQFPLFATREPVVGREPTSAGELGGGESGGGDEQRDELPQREAQQHLPPRAAAVVATIRRRH